MKEKAEDQAKEELATAQRNLNDEIKRLEAMKVELKRMQDHRTAKRAEYDMKVRSRQLKPQQMPQVDQFLRKLGEEESAFQETMKDQERRIQAAEAVVEQAKEKLVEAAKEKKAMEKHKESFMKQALKEMADKEADAQDELGQMIFMSGRNR
ncbi:MAG: hypothetical protein HYV63_31320 [Candidatus Schekmanbacteria bacterium]|nr:hypothetical protein [Candidatus Schekmanbacteria bacterium]